MSIAPRASLDEQLAHAKEDFSDSAERLMAAAQQRALDAVAAVAGQVRTSVHVTSASIADDVQLLSGAVASGLNEVKAELDPTPSIQAHPWVWTVGGLVAGLAGASLLRTMNARARTRSAMVLTSGTERRRGAIGRKLGLAAADLALGFWLAHRKRARMQAREVF